MKGQIIIVTIFCLILFGCGGARHLDKMEIGFIRSGLEIGPGNIEYIVLPANAEEKITSEAITTALNKMNLEVTNFTLPGLKPGTEYNTSITPLDDATVDAYNASPGTIAKLKIPKGPAYGLSYQLTYTFIDRKVVFDIKTTVSRKGAASVTWYEYKKNFRSLYFSTDLKDRIKTELVNITKP
jgi:hypothetical protein